MALINCPQCSCEVSSRAKACPRCGEPDPSRAERNKAIFNSLFGFLIAVGAGSYLWFVVLPELTQSFGQPASQQQSPASRR